MGTALEHVRDEKSKGINSFGILGLEPSLGVGSKSLRGRTAVWLLQVLLGHYLGW